MPKSKLRTSMSIDEVESIQATRGKIDIETVAVNNRLIKRPKFMRAQISPSFRSVGGIVTNEVEYDNYVKWIVKSSLGPLPIPPCVSPTTEPFQEEVNIYIEGDAYVYTNSFEEQDLTLTTLQNAWLVEWGAHFGHTDNKYVVEIAPGGSVQIGSPSEPVYIDLVMLQTIGCLGDKLVVEVYDPTGSLEGSGQVDENEDWVKFDELFSMGGSYGYVLIKAPDSNSYPVFIDTVSLAYYY